MRALHCDRQGCGKWQPDNCEATFISLDMPVDSECMHDRERHFCSTDCLMHWAAAQPVGAC